MKIGPEYGYFPKPSKCHLILKSTDLLNEAKELFEKYRIQITCEGERYIGAALGTEDFKTSYVQNKIKKWIKDIEMLANIAR